MSNVRYQVFVSSTYQDLIDHRQAVIKALMSVNAIPAGMETFPSADDTAWSIITRTINQSDYYVVIIGGKYGSVDLEGVSYTEKEYDYAVSKGVPIMAFLHKCPGMLTRDQTETDSKKWERLLTFRAKAEKKHCNYWETEGALVANVLASFMQMTVSNPRVGWVRGDEARTREDLEYLAKNERRLRELEEELAQYKNGQLEILKIVNEMEEEIAVVVLESTINCESGEMETQFIENYSISLHKAFSLCREILIDGADESQLNNIILQHFAENLHLDLSQSGKQEDSASIYLEENSIVQLRRFLVVRNIIDVDISIIKSRYTVHRRKTTWKLTEKGKKLALYIQSLEKGL